MRILTWWLNLITAGEHGRQLERERQDTATREAEIERQQRAFLERRALHATRRAEDCVTEPRRPDAGSVP